MSDLRLEVGKDVVKIPAIVEYNGVKLISVKCIQEKSLKERLFGLCGYITNHFKLRSLNQGKHHFVIPNGLCGSRTEEGLSWVFLAQVSHGAMVRW